ncbi:MAG: PQQ-dependent sugar dehydrogenase [Acidobacteriota bacterium]|jgi:hypothetical protein
MSRQIALLALLFSLTIVPGSAQQNCEGISETPGAALKAVRVAAGLDRPLFAIAAPGDLDRLFILEQRGTIRVVENGVLLAEPFLDVSALTSSPDNGGGNEQGLLGLAFHPDYETNGLLFIYHTALSWDNQVVRYERLDANHADPDSRTVILTIPHPGAATHNGGMIQFGPQDGYLYIASGDGGGACNPGDTAQSLQELRGKILRIDVDAVRYAIPPDNPFAGADGNLDEIWAYGLRNPFRFSIDAGTGDLYIGDVGQYDREEVDWVPGTSTGGENYGWDVFEGTLCPVPTCDVKPCSVSDYVPPVHEFDHTEGRVVIGGYVYRGCRLPDLRGTYFFANTGTPVWSFRMDGGVPTELQNRTAELHPGNGVQLNSLVSFGVDNRGEIYILDFVGTNPEGGEVFRIEPVFSALEVSGAGATPFLLDGGDPWSWESLDLTSAHPIASYRVYRSDGPGDGIFFCVHETATTGWDGDLDEPAVGGLFTYLVLGVNPLGLRSSAGAGSDGTARAVSSLTCPP